MTHDVDAVVRAEQERRDVEKFYRLIAENVNDVVPRPSRESSAGSRPGDARAGLEARPASVGKPAWEFMRTRRRKAGAGRRRARARRASASVERERWPPTAPTAGSLRTQRPVHGRDGTGHLARDRASRRARAGADRYWRCASPRSTTACSPSRPPTSPSGSTRTASSSWASPSLHAVLGWSPDDSSVRGHRLPPPRPARPRPASTGPTCARAGSSRAARFRRADGSYLWVSWQVVTPLFDDDGVYVGERQRLPGRRGPGARRAGAGREERFRRVLASAPAGMAVAGP